jgi:diguanylate cyclase (GGDEF)-like protein
MKTPFWLTTLTTWILGTDPRRRRHALFAAATLQLYVVSLAIIWHSVRLGLMAPSMATALTATGVGTFLLFYGLVRSGWSQRFADPVLTYPHALLSVAICMVAYTQLGDHRANVMILIAQTIVASMFRLKPRQMLALGLYTVAMLLAGVLWWNWQATHQLSNPISWSHLVVGGSTLLLLSLVAKWVSEIRERIGRQARELSEALMTVQHMATQDMLTGLLNRRVMTDLAETELKRVHRSGAPMCVALLDLDHFKHVNDHFGHHTGDLVLQGFASHLQPQIRQVDKLSRWGGEEFLLMLPQINATEGLLALERLRQSMDQLTISGQPNVRITFSAGLAQALPGETLEHLVERADRALYDAKRQGRNRCHLAELTTAANPFVVPESAPLALKPPGGVPS